MFGSHMERDGRRAIGPFLTLVGPIVLAPLVIWAVSPLETPGPAAPPAVVYDIGQNSPSGGGVGPQMVS
jgi:hypothetical protein